MKLYTVKLTADFTIKAVYAESPKEAEKKVFDAANKSFERLVIINPNITSLKATEVK